MINIKTDSRKVKKGDIFVALKGINSDGHNYINKAIENGATKIIAEYGTYEIPYEIVPDTRIYLNNYLQNNYNKLLDQIKIIGITGTNGKTTTAYLIYESLNKANIKCGYIGTIGFYLDKKITSLDNTTPEVTELYEMLIEAYDLGYKYMVVEVSSQGLAYKRVEGITFDYAIFTNLTQDHLDYHKTMEEYALAKQQLFKKLKKTGKAIINYDDDNKSYFQLQTNTNITYGFNGGDYQILNYNMNNINTTFTYQYQNKKETITINLIGQYNLYNMLINIIILKELNIKNISEIVEHIEAPLGRMQRIIWNNNSIIIDYAHTPDAIEKVIKTMRQVTKGNIYTVFGCTGDRDRTKRPIMTSIVTNLSRKVIITIDDLHNEDKNQIVNDMIKDLNNTNYEICLDRREAINKGIHFLQQNDTLLILGKGHEEFIIIKDEKIPFNDYKVTNELISKIL